MTHHITTSEAAASLGVTASRIRQLILAGKLPAQKRGRDFFIRMSSFNPYQKKDMAGYLTTSEAAASLGVTASRVRQLILAGRLPAQKRGRDLFIKKEDFALVKNRKPGRPYPRKSV